MSCDFPKKKCICPIRRTMDPSNNQLLQIKFECTDSPTGKAHDLTIRPGFWHPMERELIPGDILTLNVTMPDQGQRLTWKMIDNTVDVFYVDDKCMLPSPCDCYTCIGIFEKPPVAHSVKHLPFESQIFTLAKMKSDKKCMDCGAINLYFRRTCWRCNETLIKIVEEKMVA